MASNSETLKAINKLNKNQRQANNVELSDKVSSFLGKPLEEIMSGRDATSYTSNTDFSLASNISHSSYYNSLLNSINDIRIATKNNNLAYTRIKPSADLIDYIGNSLQEITMRGDALPTDGFNRLQPYDEWEANFDLYESVNIEVPEYDDSNNKADSNTEIRKLNTFANPRKLKLPSELKNAVVKAIMYVSRAEYISGNASDSDSGFNLFKSSFPNDEDGKKWYIARSLGQDTISEEDYNKITSGYSSRDEEEYTNEEKILNRTYTKEIAANDAELRRVLNANTAALRSLGNLTGADVLSDKSQTYENMWDNSAGNWWFSSNKGSHNISEVIYSLYKTGDGEFSRGGLFGDNGQVSPGFDRWTNNTASQLYAGSLNSKSTIGLVAEALFDFKHGFFTNGNKLRAGTVIGYRNYSSSGFSTTDYISVSPTVIPGGSEFNPKNKFSYGRGVALRKRIEDSLERHTSNNYAIQAIFDSGPDFMANMFDMCIFKYTRNSLENIKDTEILASFNVSPNLPYNARGKNEQDVDPNKFINNIPAHQNELFGGSKTGKMAFDDFLTRVQNISIPELRSATTDLKVLNQTLTKPLPLMESDFSSSFTIEQDAGLEYMRLFNRLAGLSLATKINDKLDFSSKYGHYNNLQINKANAGDIFDGAGSFAIAVKLRLMHESRVPKLSYIVFEGVKFLGGGQVSFKSGSAGIATYTQKFIYKNVGIMTIDNPAMTNNAVRDKAETISHTGTWATLGKSDSGDKLPINNSPMLDNGYINYAKFETEQTEQSE